MRVNHLGKNKVLTLTSCFLPKLDIVQRIKLEEESRCGAQNPRQRNQRKGICQSSVPGAVMLPTYQAESHLRVQNSSNGDSWEKERHFHNSCV